MSGEDGAVIRVVFNGANATETPLIAKMAMEENIAASILCVYQKYRRQSIRQYALLFWAAKSKRRGRLITWQHTRYICRGGKAVMSSFFASEEFKRLWIYLKSVPACYLGNRLCNGAYVASVIGLPLGILLVAGRTEKSACA
ncbi:MAG: hypothetical protein ACLR56_07935 [Oscillospiraceae bacterium]